EEGFEPNAVAAVAVLIGTSHAVEPVASLDDLVGKVDLSDVSHSAAKFDPAELAQLNARTLHHMPFEAVADRLAARGIVERAEPFWDAVRGNLAKFSEVAEWWQVIYGPVTPMIAEEDRDFV